MIRCKNACVEANCQDLSTIFVAGTRCSLCDKGTYQPLGAKDSCVSCPAPMTTVTVGGDTQDRLYLIVFRTGFVKKLGDVFDVIFFSFLIFTS